MKISEPCQQTFWSETELPLTQSVGGSPAKTLAMLESALALKVKGLVCGESTGDLLANFDPSSSSWRTSQACLVSGWEPFSETFPRSGMMLSGTVYQLPPSAPLTGGTGSGSWPTPTINGNHNKKDSSATAGDGLATAVKMWPTPTRHVHKEMGYPAEYTRNTVGLGGGSEIIPNTIGRGRPGPRLHENARDPAPGCAGKTVELVNGGGPGQRSTERGLGGVVDGISNWVDEPAGIPRTIKGQENRASRLKALGNAVVPAVVEIIGRAIMQAEAA